MGVASTKKPRLTLVKPGQKRSGRNKTKAKRKTTSFSAADLLLTLMRRICISGACLLLLAVLGIGCLAGYRWMTSHPYFALQDIKVSGNQRLTYGEVLSLAGISLNQNSLSVNISEVENRLSDNLWINSATVKRQLPGKMHILVREKTPRFMVRQGDKLYYCDSRGGLIAPVNPAKFTSLPFLNIDSDAMDKAAILPDFMDRLSRRELPFDAGQIAWIDIKGGNRMEIFMDSLNLKLLLGLNNWQEQLSHLNTVWNDLKNRGEFRDVAAITTGDGRVWVEKHTHGNGSPK